MLDNIIKRVLNEELNHPMVLTESVSISKNLKYHLDNMIELGLIYANVDVETGENVYLLTHKGKKKQKTLKTKNS